MGDRLARGCVTGCMVTGLGGLYENATCIQTFCTPRSDLTLYWSPYRLSHRQTVTVRRCLQQDTEGSDCVNQYFHGFTTAMEYGYDYTVYLPERRKRVILATRGIFGHY